MRILSRIRRRHYAAAILASIAIMTPAAALAAPAVAAAPAIAGHPRTAAPFCETPGLVEWIDTNGSGAAGSVYYHLRFTNLSGHRCTLNGFPFVVAVSLRGRQLGSRAAFNGGSPHVVQVRPGQTATALLRIVMAGNFPRSACRPVTAAGLRVYPPNQTRSKTIPFPFEACSRRGPVYLTVRPVRG